MRRRHTLRGTVGVRIPHIESSTWAGLGYGYGYAFAQDNICTMAEDYVTVDAQRSRYFGPDGSYEQRGNGVAVNNLDSDFFWQQLIDSHVIDHLLSLQPPLGLEPEAREAVRGYVAGYNRYLADVGGTNLRRSGSPIQRQALGDRALLPSRRPRPHAVDDVRCKRRTDADHDPRPHASEEPPQAPPGRVAFLGKEGRT